MLYESLNISFFPGRATWQLANNVQDVQECDATKFNSYSTAGPIKNFGQIYSKPFFNCTKYSTAL